MGKLRHLVLRRSAALTLIVATAGLAAGGALRLLGRQGAADVIWGTVTGLALVPAATTVARDLWHRRAGVDIVAVLALLGSLLVGQYLAGAVIAVMLATGRALEARAAARARRELRALLDRAPAVAHRIEGEQLVTVPLDQIKPGDEVLVASGEVIPVDGVVAGTAAVLDESALTGETALVERDRGDPVRSGGVNAGGAFRLRAAATAAESTYAGIVRLVREAESSRAPLVRLADRFALLFVPLTLVIAAVAGALSRDPVRAVAVLVVATPCPLILAAPVALVGGMSRAARRGIVVKSGAALEALAQASVLLFDKTGTLTEGRARLADVECVDGVDPDEVLRLAASLDQASVHVLAAPIARAARERGLELTLPGDVIEEPGSGVRGTVAGRMVAVGRAAFVAGSDSIPSWARRVRRRTAYEGLANVFVGIDGRLAGALVMEDPLRPDAGLAVQRLRSAGIRRIVLVTGDHPDVAQPVATALGIDAVYAERTPAEKLDVVRTEREAGHVVMAGDGINDAPALASADVGVAMGIRGASASSETADVVLMVDRIDRLAEAVHIARRSHRIALQSIVAGMGLSFIAMGFAAFGSLIPVIGAIVQEGIDLAVILNALRAHAVVPRGPSAAAVSATRDVLEDHAAMRAGTARMRAVADELGRTPPATARTHLQEVRRFITDSLLPHEQQEERLLYPAVARYVGGDEALVAARREHAEVAHLAAIVVRMVDDIGGDGPDDDDAVALRRVLYSLHAVLTLHRSAEEERLMRVVDTSRPDELRPAS